MTSTYVRWFEELGRSGVAIVGGKNASLGEVVSRVTDAGVHVPSRFAVAVEGIADSFTTGWPARCEVRAASEALDRGEAVSLHTA